MARDTISAGKPYEKTQPHGPGVVVSGRLLYTSGIVSRDADGNTVGKGDMAAQVAQVFRNLEDVLRAAGTDFTRVVKFTIYTTDMEAYLPLRPLVNRYVLDKPASTLVEVSRLASPDMMVEVELVVALD